MTRRRAIATPDARPGSVERYREGTFDDGRRDLYQSRRKYKEPTACGRCGDVYDRGGWRWGDAPTHAQLEISPACAHSRDKLPPGFMTVPGKFFDTHRLELLQLARHAAGQEGAEHLLHRVRHIAETPAEAVLTCAIHSGTPHRRGVQTRLPWRCEHSLGRGRVFDASGLAALAWRVPQPPH